MEPAPNPHSPTRTSTPITASYLRGALELEPTGSGVLPHRLPAWARAQAPDAQLAMAEAQPAGVRLVFRTCATVVEVDASPARRAYLGVPARPGEGVVDLLVDGELAGQGRIPGGSTTTIDLATGDAERVPGPPGTLTFTGLPARMKRVEVWLPYNEVVELVALRTDAPVEPVPAGDRPVWLHHGSSISQGSNAVSPSTTWPALSAAAADVELINLGFAGSALLDPFTARTMRQTPADLISVEIGINLVNSDAMRMRAFVPAVHGFLDTIRDGHPATPLLVVSSICCPIHEDTPGPGAFDPDALRQGRVAFVATGRPAECGQGKLTLRSIRAELARIVGQRAKDDPQIHYLDGLDLYGPEDVAQLPLADALHPDAAAHRRIAGRFVASGFHGPWTAGLDRSRPGAVR